MELRLLESFLAVAREQNITAAARSLHISQPALSAQMKQLEQELDTQLLVRGSKGSRKVVLTEEGMILRQRAREVLSLVEQTEEEIKGSGPAVTGSIRISAAETDGVRLLARALDRIRQANPEVRMEISSGNAVHVLEELDRGLADFGLVFGPVDPRVYEMLALPDPDVWGVLVRRDDALAQKKAAAPEDLRQRPLILSRQSDGQALLAGWFQCEPSRLQVAATYNLVYNASILAEEGVGYALCLDRLVHTEGTSLCFLPLTPRLESGACLVWKKYQVFSRASSLFLKTLRQVLEAPRAD